ncbi:uncharacterized protein G6M90_00g097810 [Metarhizium brunneum]|uniref:Single-strand DNA deaminase toxin A-like C-terminal domain-containing protein n=1 Tax=Metarhizium brunneum TaxID=500148 RepID=A0A7D5Z3F1_9HYPO
MFMIFLNTLVPNTRGFSVEVCSGFNSIHQPQSQYTYSPEMWDYSTLQFFRYNPPDGVSYETASAEEIPCRNTAAQRRKESLLAAIALHWSDSRVTVLCPFCSKTHVHGISHFRYHGATGWRIQDDLGRYIYDGPSPTRCDSRVAQCEKKDSDVDIEYVIIFPFENDCRVAGLSFEIERIPDDDDTKLEERFRTVGLKTIPADVLEELESCYPDESSEPSELADRLQDVALEDGDYDIISERDGVEEVMTERASVYLASAACCGSVNEMRPYLEGSPNPTALLQFKDKDGLSLLALAVPNGHRKAVEYLLELGSNVNVTDAKGRTPLMEAALWSHPKIVELLLEAGADGSLKDRRGMTAGNLAEESERNDRERHKRHSKYSEDPFIKKRHRRLIRALLKHTPAMSTSTGIQPDLADLTDAFFYKSLSAATISLVIPRQGIEILTQSKTAAVLVRGGAFPPVVAVSGRTNPVHSEFRSPEAGYLRLNEGYWGGVENFAIAEAIGFSFESDRRDKAGVEGSFNASHAEAQLMCFFVTRNYIFRNFEAGQVQYGDDFLQLFMLQERNRQAKIIVSQEPCPSCRALRDRILDRLGIDFSLSECSG